MVKYSTKPHERDVRVNGIFLYNFLVLVIMRVLFGLFFLFHLLGCKGSFLTSNKRRSYYQEKYADNALQKGDIQISIINHFDKGDVLTVYEADSLLFQLTGTNYDAMKLLATRIIYNSNKPTLHYKVILNDSLSSNFIITRTTIEPLLLVVGKEKDKVLIGEEKR